MVNASGKSHPSPPDTIVDLLALATKGDLAGLEKGVAALRTIIATLDKKDNGPTQAALTSLSALASTHMVQAQPFLLDCLTSILDATGDKKASTETKAVAASCAKMICAKVSPNALALIFPTLRKAIHFESRWQTRVAALDIIAEFSDHAPEQLGHALPEVIPEVSQCIVDLKAEV
jgi:elongation factor 3